MIQAGILELGNVLLQAHDGKLPLAGARLLLEQEDACVLNNLPALSLEGVNTEVLNPRLEWSCPDAYDQHALKLADLFIENFNTYGDSVAYLLDAGPSEQNKIAI